jgi:protein gp37
MYKRFKWNEQPTISLGAFDGVAKIKEPSKIFVGSTFELFHEVVVNSDYQPMDWILNTIKKYPQHAFIFLTKCPQNLIKYSPFPDNCWVGVSTTGNDCRSGLEDIMTSFQAKVKFVSIEPLLDYSPMDFRWVNWVIVGQQTTITEKTRPNPDWIRGIITECNRENVPIFIKDNIINDHVLDLRLTEMRQEYPRVL